MYRQAPDMSTGSWQCARPAVLPVEQPVEMGHDDQSQDRRTLGITIPKSLLLRADG